MIFFSNKMEWDNHVPFAQSQHFCYETPGLYNLQQQTWLEETAYFIMEHGASGPIQMVQCIVVLPVK